MKRERMFFGVVVSVVGFVFLFACSGCATDFKLSGPTLSLRSGMGKDSAWGVASQPIGTNRTSMGSSAASASPMND
jgi:hypothetical protein